MQDIEFNEIRGSSMQLFPKNRINVPAASRHIEEITIPGRDGVLIKKNKYAATPIPIAFNYIGPADRWSDYWRAAQKWLSANNARLRISDDSDYFYKITYVELSENERNSDRVGNFTATFHTRDGLQYLISGTGEYDIEDVLWNPYEECHPIYKIAAEGVCNLTVNGHVMQANVGQNLTIDTDRMIAYREDGTLQNTSVTGKYEDLYLLEGENSIEITGGTVKVIPNWRCL